MCGFGALGLWADFLWGEQVIATHLSRDVLVGGEAGLRGVVKRPRTLGIMRAFLRFRRCLWDRGREFFSLSCERVLMPIYAYRCEACDHELDVLQRISDDPLTDCPACGKATLKKQLTAPSFRLGGSGWYETDFKTGNKRNLAGEQGSSASDAGSTSNSSATSSAAD